MNNPLVFISTFLGETREHQASIGWDTKRLIETICDEVRCELKPKGLTNLTKTFVIDEEVYELHLFIGLTGVRFTRMNQFGVDINKAIISTYITVNPEDKRPGITCPNFNTVGITTLEDLFDARSDCWHKLLTSFNIYMSNKRHTTPEGGKIKLKRRESLLVKIQK